MPRFALSSRCFDFSRQLGCVLLALVALLHSMAAAPSSPRATHIGDGVILLHDLVPPGSAEALFSALLSSSYNPNTYCGDTYKKSPFMSFHQVHSPDTKMSNDLLAKFMSHVCSFLRILFCLPRYIRSDGIVK